MARNAITKAAARETSAPAPQQLPHSVALVLKDPPPVEVEGELKPVAWRLPTMMPTKEQLEESRAFFAHALKPVGGAMRAALLPYMTIFEIPNLLEGMTEAQELAWFNARFTEYERLIGHLPLDILKSSVDAHVMTGSKFFPAIFEIMQHAGPELEKRKRGAERVGYMLEHLGKPKPKPTEAAFIEDPRHVKLLTLLKWQEQIGSRLYSVDKAAATRRELAKLAEAELDAAAIGERDPEAWALVDYLAGVGSVAHQPAPQPKPPVHPMERSTATPLGAAASAVVREAMAGGKAEAWQAGEPLYQQRQEEPPPPTEIPE